MSRAGRKATLVLLSNAAGAALGYATLLLIGRYFAPASYGAYLFAASATGLLALFGTLGLGSAHQRQIARGVPPDQALGVLVRLRGVLGAATLALFALAYGAWSWLGGGSFTDATTPTIFLLAVLVQVASNSRQVLLDTWQGQQRVHRVELVRLADTALTALLVANVALMLAHLQGRWEVLPGVGSFWAHLLKATGPPTAEQAGTLLAACYLLAKASTLAAGWAWSLRDPWRVGSWNRDLARAYMRQALPFALMGALALVLQYTDSLMLGFFWTAREVGVYGAAQRLSSVALLAATALSTVLFPRFAQLHAAEDAARAGKTLEQAERYLLLLATPVVAAMVALPRQGLHVAVGDAYLDAAVPLRLLALWALVSTMTQPIGSRFMGEGQLKVLTKATAFDATANALLNALFIPEAGLGLGPTGAALATLTSSVATFVYLRWQAHERFRVPWLSAAQMRILGAGMAVGLGWWAAARWIGPEAFDRAWKLIAWGLGGGGAYLLALLAFGAAHAHDLAFLRKAAHPRQLLDELRGR